jgi:putative nucleotidyltransferase with HDIG domain
MQPNRLTGGQHEAEERWASRPVLAWLVRTTSLAVPVGLGVGAGFYAGHLFQNSDGLGGRLLAWLVASVVGTAILIGTDRLFRRLVPLALLLRLSLAFPDHAPRRFSVALRATWTVRPERQLARLSAVVPGEDAAGAARRIVTLMAALTAHDRRTRGHSERVRALVDMTAVELGLDPRDIDRLRWAALLHDIGKLGTSGRILRKPSGLTAQEWHVIRRHPAVGADMAAGLRPWLGEWWDGIGQHHERWDGGGYPHRLVGAEISRAARIIAVADTFEVMTAARPYARAVSTVVARRELVAEAGQQFDPEVVRAFLNISLGRLHWAATPLVWIGQLPLLRALPPGNLVATLAGPQATGTLAVLVVAGAVSVGAVAPPAAGAGPVHPVSPSSTASSLVAGSGPPSPTGLGPTSATAAAAPATRTAAAAPAATSTAAASSNFPSADGAGRSAVKPGPPVTTPASPAVAADPAAPAALGTDPSASATVASPNHGVRRRRHGAHGQPAREVLAARLGINPGSGGRPA